MTSVYDAWCGLVEVHAGLIERIAVRHGLSVGRLLRSSLLCVALHDVGKLSKNFQRMMSVPLEELKAAVQRNYRHEVASIWLTHRLASQLDQNEPLKVPGGGLLEVMAVAGHHKFLADDFLFNEDRFLNLLDWEPDAWTAVVEAVKLATEMFKDQGNLRGEVWGFPARLSPTDIKNHLIHSNVNETSPPFVELWTCKEALSNVDGKEKTHFREIFLLLKGLLMTADWMASGAKGRIGDLDAHQGIVRVEPRQMTEWMTTRGQSLRPFQSQCNKAPGHVIAVAPTGSGKTEASWLWALNQVEQGHSRKIIVLLPTMVTSNSIHDRLTKFFGEHGHEVGLVHSTADLVRESNAEGDEADHAEVRAKALSESHYFRPVTVGTVDQLLVPLFHAGRWAMKTFAAADAAIIIDEVHAYDPHTLALISLMIEQLGALGTRFMVMSATMPKPLKRLIQKRLESSGTAATLIEADDLLDSARNVWTTYDQTLEEWLFRTDAKGRKLPSLEFLELLASRNERDVDDPVIMDKPLKILIVVNTVKRCQEISRTLHDFGLNLTCYHSKFIFDDRKAKEERINKKPPRLLIATQVVEVSLDIDYDILLTECAPIDALIQRAGRVNRRRDTPLGRVFIFRHDSQSENIYKFPSGILESTWNVLNTIESPPTERKLVAMVEEVYKGRSLDQDEAFLAVYQAAIAQQSRLDGVLDSPKPFEEDALLKTRPDDYPQLSVIPNSFYKSVKVASPHMRKRYELKVPVWYAKQHSETKEDLPFCAMNYDSEFGAELLSTKDRTEPGQYIF